MTERAEQGNNLAPAIDRFMGLLPELLQEHEGEFIVISPDGEEILGYWSSMEEALGASTKEYGLGSRLIREVSREYEEYGRLGKPKFMGMPSVTRHDGVIVELI